MCYDIVQCRMLIFLSQRSAIIFNHEAGDVLYTNLTHSYDVKSF